MGGGVDMVNVWVARRSAPTYSHVCGIRAVHLFLLATHASLVGNLVGVGRQSQDVDFKCHSQVTRTNSETDLPSFARTRRFRIGIMHLISDNSRQIALST